MAIKRRRPLLALYGANAVSMVGNQVTLIAVPWFVLETTGSGCYALVILSLLLNPALREIERPAAIYQGSIAAESGRE